MKKHIFFILSMLLLSNGAFSQTFDKFFTDKTLRIDYIFSGSATEQEISVDKMSCLPHWYGKRCNLSQTPVEGNGQIFVYQHQTQQLIYKYTFSTLFQEWQSYPEAQSTRKAFQHVALLPYPNDTVDVKIQLFNNRREVVAIMQHTIAPGDILIQPKGFSQCTPYETILQPTDTLHAINIAFVAEGYQQEEMDVFIKDVNTAVEALFEYEPFKGNKDKFRIIAVKSPSVDSGVSLPRAHDWKQTAVSSHFDTFYMDRYLTTLQLQQVHDLLAGLPYEHIIILANTSTYGGGGILNLFNLTSTLHKYYKEVVVHEFGHSFAGLADEYAYENEPLEIYPLDIEPWEPNITTLVAFNSKWETSEGNTSGTGLFEGSGYRMKGIYRPTPDCRMRSNQHPDFCPVCQQGIQRVIDSYSK